MISIIVLAAVFALIAVRRVGSFRLKIWQIMCLGAVVVLLTGQIAPIAAFKSINLDVLLFLFGTFVIGKALEESGLLEHWSGRFFSRAGGVDAVVLLILFGGGLLAAVLMNDTLAIIGTPLLLTFAIRTKVRARLLLLALAFAITTGSVMSPIGNPQNLLIALHSGLGSPFVTFARYLAIPTILNLVLCYLILKLFYRHDFGPLPAALQSSVVLDRELAKLCRISLIILVLLIALKIALALLDSQLDLRLTWIALAAALPIALFSRRRLYLMKNIDWATIAFFVGMFVLMASVWNSGIFQSWLEHMQLDLLDRGVILGTGVILSQLISNVPMVALFLPVLIQSGSATAGLMSLAAGSTIAGNLSILGAASNVIIIQGCESRSDQTITFWEFFRVGLPLTAVQVAVYWLFLNIT